MFKIDDTPRFRRTITVMVPDGDGHRTDTFTAEFEAISDSEHDTFDTTTTAGIRALLARVVRRLDDIADQDGELIPYSEDLRDRVFDRSYVRIALLGAYMDALVGAKLGN